MKELTTEPQPCIACLGAKRSSEDRGVDRGQPGDAGGLNAETNRAGTLCDHCGGTGLDPESLLGDWSDYGRAAVRWLIFEAPGDWSRDRCLQHIRDVWGDLTVLEIRFRTAREREAIRQDALFASSASILARETLMAFSAKFAKSELVGVKNPIPINNLIGRFSRGAIEALEKAFAESRF